MPEEGRVSMEYVKIPNLPVKKVKRVIVDYRADEKIISSLQNLGIIVYLSCEIPSLYDAVKGHPDMSICHIGANNFVCEPSTYSYYKKTLKLENINLIKGYTHLTSTYPHDIAYNVARVSVDKAFHKTAFTDREILLNSKSVNLINIAQGYSKCNVCVVSENAIITQDESIYINALNNGINTLKISNGNIFLKGFDYGFIGGASGLVSNDILAVTGNVENLVDYDRIIEFCTGYGVKVYALTDDIPADIGSIIPISYD